MDWSETSWAKRWPHLKVSDPRNETVFWHGEGRMESFDGEQTRFRLSNGALVSIRNDLHKRLKGAFNPFRKTMEVVAPVTAITELEGELPVAELRVYTLDQFKAGSFR